MPDRLDMPEASRPVADAEPGNWVDRFAPAAARPYLRLSRADRPAGSWLLFIPCLWGLLLAIGANPDSLQRWDAWIAGGCALGAILMRGAGCTWNDIADRHIDARVARTRSRPLPAGQVTVAQAAGWMALQAALAAAILFSFNSATILIGLASLLPVLVYPFAKRFTWWPQLFLGVAFNWGVLLAWTAHAGALDWPALPMYLAGLAWTLFYDTIYAHQDREDDALIGVRSTARLFGARTPAWLAGFLAAAVGLMAAAVVAAFVPRGASGLALGLALAGVWAFGWHLWWQLRRFDMSDPERCLALFRSNRTAGLLPALFLAAALLA